MPGGMSRCGTSDGVGVRAGSGLGFCGVGLGLLGSTCGFGFCIKDLGSRIRADGFDDRFTGPALLAPLAVVPRSADDFFDN
jgi:hypothetical protein